MVFSVFSLTLITVLLLVLYSISTFSSPRPFPCYFDTAFLFRRLLADASDDERYNLVVALKSVPAIRNFENVDVIGKPDRFSYMGSSYIAATLHAAALLMKFDRGWDWFISLSALDYPLITQDDLSHVFSSVRRDLNFIDHTSDLGWKEYTNPFPKMHRSLCCLIVITSNHIGSFCSPWVVLSRSFLEFCIFGWDNLPRTLMMYFNNVMLSEESYFQSVICNSPEFKNTTVNGDLRYMIWDNPPKMEPHYLNISDYGQMVQSGAAFARMFRENDPVLDMVDEKILKLGPKRAVPGPWCTGQNSWWSDPCSQWGDVNVVKPGPQAKKYGETVNEPSR
ncbi:Pentatricopeptide repeat-containing protein, putative isoform 1 [Hibiscus syriacus]|uniref:Pentatricopeptide repeat-containing protein, putative isoform 1 n=1 Tax=Hibiscus syriacus TaxID=106335 RepID=A0A6A2X0H6_HIBSY|nr:Pentatricopeptide repeat-containing protein, putative isoform 1 [Hibiscus syriacus]